MPCQFSNRRAARPRNAPGHLLGGANTARPQPDRRGPAAVKMVFLDTETTGVHRERRAWEIAMIRREDDVEYTLTIYVSQDDLDLDHADPVGLAIGRFQQRHPGIAGNPRCGSDEILCSEAQAARIVAQWTARATIFGVVPHFDTECLACDAAPARPHTVVALLARRRFGGRARLPAGSRNDASTDIGSLVSAVRRGAAERRSPPHGSGRRCMGAALAGPDEPGRCRRARRASHRRIDQTEAKDQARATTRQRAGGTAPAAAR